MQDEGFEWDDDKAAINLQEHDVSFREARSVFEVEERVELFDDAHSVDETRYAAIGFSSKGRLLFVTFTMRDSRTRIIHAHVAGNDEEQIYEDNH